MVPVGKACVVESFNRSQLLPNYNHSRLLRQESKGKTRRLQGDKRSMSQLLSGCRV